MKICIVSDSHDHREPLAAAVREAKSLGARAVLHCGDLIAPSTLHAIVGLGLPIHLIHGNNTGYLYYLSRFVQESGNRVHYYGQDGSLTSRNGASSSCTIPTMPRRWRSPATMPWYATAMKHRAVVERVRNIQGNETLRIDPGTVAGVSAPATYVFGDLCTMEFSIRPVPSQAVA